MQVTITVVITFSSKEIEPEELFSGTLHEVKILLLGSGT